MGNFSQRLAESLRLTKQRVHNAMVPYSFPRQEEMPLRHGRHNVIVAVDNSYSTLSNGADREINQGTSQFARDVAADPNLRGMVEISVWAFGGSTPTELFADAVPVERFEMPRIPTGSFTPLYTMIRDCLRNARGRKQHLENVQDCELASTWLFLFSDFGANDDEVRDEALVEIQQATQEQVNIFPLLAGEYPCEEVANEIAQPGRPPILLRSVDDYKEFFTFLRRSLRAKSTSMPGTQIDLGQCNGVDLRGDA